MEMEQLKQVVAYTFKIKGKEKMAAQEFIFTLSMDMHWFSPDDAKRLIERCTQANILVQENDSLRPNFELSAIEIPLEFQPSKDLLEYKKDLFLELIEVIEQTTKLDKKDIIAEINKLQARLNIEIEVVAMLVAKKYKIDISNYIESVEKEVVKRYAN